MTLATKTISFTLDAKSIGKAIKELETYRRDFADKCVQLRKLIAEKIKWSAQDGFSKAIVSDTYIRIEGKEKTQISPTKESNVQVHVDHQDHVSVVFTEGDEAVFIEYGAGVYYNGNPGDSPHPWGLEQGYVIGGYGKNKGVNNRWVFKDATGDVFMTHGTPAAMPMYRGAEEAVRMIGELIQEVFG